MLKVIFSICRSVNDPEKCITPTILFINMSHRSFGDLRRKGMMFAVGWWHFSIKVYIIKRQKSTTGIKCDHYSGYAWKHHLSSQVKPHYEGAGAGATIFTDYSVMLEYLKKDGRDWHIAELYLIDAPIRYDFKNKNMVTILCDAASGPFYPAPI